jgi:hypothetical protein
MPLNSLSSSHLKNKEALGYSSWEISIVDSCFIAALNKPTDHWIKCPIEPFLRLYKISEEVMLVDDSRILWGNSLQKHITFTAPFKDHLYNWLTKQDLNQEVNEQLELFRGIEWA